MANQILDNFKFQGTNTSYMTDSWWSAVVGTLVADPDPNASGNVYHLGTTGNSQNWVGDRIALPTPTSKVGVATRVYLPGLPGSSGSAVAFTIWSTIANVMLRQMVIEPNGAISFYDQSNGITGAQGSLIATTGAPVVGANSWYHLESFFDGSTGEYECRVEGHTVLSGTHTTTANIGIINFAPRITFGNTSTYIKDLAIWDGLGSENNNFMGTCTVYFQPVDGDDTTPWGTSSGSVHYSLLDESNPNDADYTEADATPPAADVLTLLDLPADVVTVKSVITVVRAEKTDGGTASMQVSLDSGGSLATGSTHNVTTAFKYWYDVQEIDPDTTDPWTPTGFNAAKLKLDRTA